MMGSGVALMFRGVWLEQAFAALSFIVLARLLGAEIFGIAMMAMSVIILVEVLVRDTITDFLIQTPHPEDGHFEAVFWTLIGLAVVLVAMIWAAAPAIAHLFETPIVSDLLRGVSPTIVCIALAGVPVVRLRRAYAYRPLALRSSIGSGLGGIAGVVAALMFLGPWSIVAQRLVQVVAAEGIAIFSPHGWRPRFIAKRHHFLDVWRFSLKVVSLRISEISGMQAPSFVIGAMLGPAALGHYTVAWRIVDIAIELLSTPIRYVAQPSFARLQYHRSAAGRLLLEAGEVASFIAFPGLLGLAVVADPLILALLGPGWEDSVAVLQVLCILGLCFSIEHLNQSFCLAMGRTSSLLVFSAIETLVGLLLALSASHMGAEMVALAWALGFLAIWPIRLAFVSRLAERPASDYLAAYAVPVLLSIAMALTVSIARQMLVADSPPLVDLAVAVLIGVASYTIISIYMVPNRIERVKRLVGFGAVGGDDLVTLPIESVAKSSS
jgi:O-antigen/teichoic acid export membrane protein